MRAFFVDPPGPGGGLIRDLVYGCWCGGKRVGGASFPPVPLAQIATLLKCRGIPAFVIDASAEKLRTEEIAARVLPGDLLFLMSSPLSSASDLRFLSDLRKRTGIRTVLYGAFPTFQPGQALRSDGVDFILRGEPEIAALSLAAALRDGARPGDLRIEGIGTAPGGSESPGFAPRPDLDSLPVPDRSMIPDGRVYFNPVVRHPRFTTAFTSRGCFGRCTYCSSGSFFAGTARYRSADSVLAELEEIRSLGFREVFFRDELFTGDRKRLETLCEGIPRRTPRLEWVCSTRVDRIDAPAAKAMRAAGCHLVRMGVESGSQAVLDRIRKGITIDQTRAAFSACRVAGIDTHAHTMVGLPGETREDFRRTLRLIREIRPTYLTMSICTPFPGTALFQELETHGGMRETDYLERNRSGGLHSAPVHNHLICDIPSAELAGCLRRAYREHYFRWEYLMGRLSSVRSPRMFLRRAASGMALASMVFRHV